MIATLPSQGVAADLFRAPLQAMKRLDADIAEPSQKAPLLENALAAIVATAEQAGFANLGDDDVRDFYDASRMAAYYSYAPSAALQMRRAWDELDRRHVAPPGAADEIVETYVAARLFADADAFYRAHRSAVRVPPPAFVDLSGRTASMTLLDVADGGAMVRRREFSRRDGAKVVVIGSPWCPYSRAATEAIESDAGLAPLMAAHATWVIPQQIVRDVRSVAQWNLAHPAAAMALMFRHSEWPFVRSTATPAFYFFRDGRLVSSFSGWPGADQKIALLAGLEGVGITPLRVPAP